MRGSQLRAVLEAAFTELEGAIDALTAVHTRLAVGSADAQSRSDAISAERQLLRAAFQDAPVALFLLTGDGTVQRINARAADLLGTRPGYATGKLFTAFVGLPLRAAVQTQLAAVARTGKSRRIQCQLLTKGGTADSELRVARVTLRGDADQLIVAAAAPGAGPSSAATADVSAGRRGSQPVAEVVQAMTHRYDLVTSATRLLLDNATFSESVTLQRCARLLATELAAWVIVDMERRQRLRRQFVIGPEDPRSAELARATLSLDPQPGSAPYQVHESGSSVLTAHAEEPGILGIGPDGVPVLLQLGATSVLSVALTDGERSYGVLTLARQPGEGHFEIADLGLVEELGEQLALAIKVDRMFRRRTEIADALQRSLLPGELPAVPGVDIAATYLGATEGIDVGGDFYDVYRTPAGWGIAIGDVCGKGELAAAVTAAARHAIRVLGHWNPDPADTLRKANEILLTGEFDGRFITASVAHLQWRNGLLHVVLASSGHPAPFLVHPDGRARLMRGGGLPLGLFPEAEPGVEEFDLSAGDILFFFTDGVAEARNSQMAYFDDRMTDELAALAGKPPADVVSTMRGVVTEFCLGELCDDMTMLCLRAGEPPAE